MLPRALLPALLIATFTLTACAQQRDAQPAAPATAAAPAPQTALGRQVEKAMREAREKLATENINLNSGVQIGEASARAPSDLPKGEITPAGDLLVDGKPVAIDAAQRALLLKYRGHVIAIAEAGMAIGVRGADLGVRAMGEAFKGIFTGDTENIEQKIEAQASQIETEAQKLCDLMPAMYATQQQLAAQLPAFKPYARMEQRDIDDCRDETTGKKRTVVRDEVRQEIREAIRGTTQQAAQPASDPAREAAAQAEADAASAAAKR